MQKPTTSVADVLRLAEINGLESAVQIELEVEPPTAKQMQTISTFARRIESAGLATKMGSCTPTNCTCSSGACWFGQRAQLGGALTASVFELVTQSQCLAEVFVESPEYSFDTISIDMELMREFVQGQLVAFRDSLKSAEIRSIGYFVPVLHVDGTIPHYWGLGLRQFIGATDATMTDLNWKIDRSDLDGRPVTASDIDVDLLLQPPAYLVASDRRPYRKRFVSHPLSDSELHVVEMWHHRFGGMRRLFDSGHIRKGYGRWEL